MPRLQVKSTEKNSMFSPTPSSSTSISVHSLKNMSQSKERTASIMSSLLKVSRLLIPTTMDPSHTKKSRLDLRSSPNPKTTPSPKKSGLGSRRQERELTLRPQERLMRKNSIDLPTLFSDISISAILLRRPKLKRTNLDLLKSKKDVSIRNSLLKVSRLLIPTTTDPSHTMKSKLDLRSSPNPKTTR